MSATWIWKLPQVDKPGRPVLVRVIQKHGTDLDLDLLATDGEDAYRGKVRQRNLSKLRTANYEGTDLEWSTLLRSVLVSRNGHDKTNATQDRNVEVDCSIAGRGSKRLLSVVLRSRIEDITHKLGTIELSYSENTDDVDLFGWACILADQRDELEVHATFGKKESQRDQETLLCLQGQLDDLIKAKEEHEEQLLSKFAALLNEKKLKIREQQRVLQTAKVDKAKLDQVLRTTTALDSKNRKDTNKRKRTSGAEDGKTIVDVGGSAEEAEDSEGFEAMDVDDVPSAHAKSMQNTFDSGDETPSRSDSPDVETASENEEDNASVARQTKQSTREPSGGTRGSPAPPRRSLPFQQKHEERQSQQIDPNRTEAGKIDNAETESEDDEL